MWEPDYITAEELKAYARISHDNDDDEIVDAITAASRAIDRHCHRQFGKVDSAETRYYTAEFDSIRSLWVVPIDDLMTTTDFVADVDSSGEVITTYKLLPRNAAQKARPWTSLGIDGAAGVVPTYLDDDVAVTAIWGWSAVPSAVKFACKLQAFRFLKRRESPYGVAGSPEAGNELRLLSRVDPDVGVSLRDYVRLVGPL